MEPEPEGLKYPLRAETSEDFKITVTVLGIMGGLLFLACLVFSPFIYHTCLHVKDRLSDRCKRKRNHKVTHVQEDIESKTSEQLN